MDRIQPELNNAVLWTNGNFKPLLEELLDNKTLRKEYIELFEYSTVLELFESMNGDSNNNDSDSDIKNDEPEMTKMETFELYKDCLNRTFKDTVCGIFNRAVWGYLKQLKPDKDALTMSDKLRLTLNTTQIKFSSLQVYE